MKKKILFIIPTQYGYHTDSYKYCELLSNVYDVFYLGLDNEYTQRRSDHVKVYSLRPLKLALWRLNLFIKAFSLHNKYHFDKIFIYSFPLCSLFLLIFSKNKMIMDIRTSFIEGWKSKYLNNLLRLESHFFKYISVISYEVSEFLLINKEKCLLLPLGGDDTSFKKKSIETISLLYVGTFYDRHIEKTIEGFYLFVQKNINVKIEYTIIGVGSDIEKQKIIDTISRLNLSDYVHFVGEKRHEALYPFWCSHNVGVSYIPLTDYYDCQPPTKTYEYLLNTMIVIATPTTENCKVINSSNGIILNGDSAIDFALGLEQLSSKIKQFNFFLIYEKSKKYTWDRMVEDYLIPIIEMY